MVYLIFAGWLIVFTAATMRSAWREQCLCRALLLALTGASDQWIGWPEFKAATGLSEGYRGAFYVAGTYLTQEGMLLIRHDPPPPGRKARQARYKLRRQVVVELYPGKGDAPP